MVENFNILAYTVFYLLLAVKFYSGVFHLAFQHVSAGILMQTTRKYTATNEIIFSPNASKILRKIKIKIQ